MGQGLAEATSNHTPWPFLVTPSTWADRLNIVVPAAPSGQRFVAPQRIKKRGGNALLGIMCGRLAYSLQSIHGLPEVLKLSARVLCPEKNLDSMDIPSGEMLRRIIIKLDLPHMRSREVFLQPGQAGVRVARCLSPDSSPQGKREYLCTTEELMVHNWPIDTSAANFNALGGFDHEIRSLPCMTLARAKAMWLKRKTGLLTP